MKKTKKNEPMVDITFAIPRRWINYLIISAIEDGSTYWSNVEATITSGGMRDESALAGVQYAANLVTELGGSLVFSHSDGVDEYSTKYEGHELAPLSLARCIIGLRTMATEAPQQLGAILAENWDRNSADCFLQCALFGTIVYE